MKSKKITTALLALVMVLSVISTAISAVASTDELVAHYDMSLNDTDTALKDVSGKGNDAKLSSSVSASDFSDGIWTLANNSSKYAELPLGVITDENFTIEVRATVSASANQFLWVLGTTEGTWPTPKNYIFLNPKTSESALSGQMLAGIKDDGTSGEVRLNSTTALPVLSTGTYYTMTMTSENGVLKLYVDGNLVCTCNHSYSSSMSDILAGDGDSILGYIGKSLYTSDAGYSGKIDSFKIFNYTQTEAEIKENYENNNDVIADALAAITIPNSDDIRGNITLLDEINGVDLTWEEVTSTGIVTLTSSSNSDYDDTPAGVVTRQAADTDVTLKVTASYNGHTGSKEINITVKAEAAQLDDSDFTGYLMAYFAGDGSTTEQVFLATSEDGLNWTSLNDGQAVLTSEMGDMGIRDPYIARSPEGDKFYLIATDLCIANQNWDWSGVQNSGSQSIMVWESTDLVNWSEQRMVEVSASINAGCTWAPEFYYDEITGEYVVFWASKVSDYGYDRHRVYYSKTRDFYTFTEPQVLIDSSANGGSAIDTTYIYNESDGYYYRYTKNEGQSTIFLERGTSILGDFEMLSGNIGIGGVEGPSVFKFNSKDSATDKWCLLLDDFSTNGKRYYPTIVTDLADTSTYTAPSSYSMPTPKACHGSVINLTTAEYKAVVAAYTDLVTEKTTYAATYVEELPDLPATVAGVDADGNAATYEVTWDDNITTSDFASPYETVAVTGVANGTTVTCYVEVVPENLLYFIDANAYDGSNTTDGSSNTTSAFEAVSDLVGSSLLNKGADQLYQEGTNTWGYKSSDGTTYTKSAASGDYNKQTTTGRYGSNTNGTYISYFMTVPAGTYKLTAGSYSWWPTNSRTEQVEIYDDNNNLIESIGTYTLNSDKYSYVLESSEFTLAENMVIEFRMTVPSGAQAPMFSWLGVEEIKESDESSSEVESSEESSSPSSSEESSEESSSPSSSEESSEESSLSSSSEESSEESSLPSSSEESSEESSSPSSSEESSEESSLPSSSEESSSSSVVSSPSSSDESNYIEYDINNIAVDDKTGDIVFTVNGNINDFVNILLDGSVLSTTSYTVISSGDNEITITLSGEFLKTLDIGNYELTIQFVDGSAYGELEIYLVDEESVESTVSSESDSSTVSADSSSKSSSTAATVKGNTTKSSAAKTGDYASIYMLAILIVAVSTIVVFRKRNANK